MKTVKFLPAFVFLAGLTSLIYSAYTFFSSGAAPIAVPATTTATASQLEPTPIAVPPKVERTHAIDRTPEPTDNVARTIREAARKPAETYLKEVRLEMNIPEDILFRTTQEGPVKVLVGSTAPDKDGFLIFSRKDKLGKTLDYLKKTLSEEIKTTTGSSQEYFNRGGFSEMRLWKGQLRNGDEFQAYSFQNPRTKMSHIVYLSEKQLSRQPARVRAIVDSLQIEGGVGSPAKPRKRSAKI